MQKENKKIQNSNALKGFLLNFCHAHRYKNVGQARPDNAPSKKHPSVLIMGKDTLCCQVKPDLHSRRGFTLIELLVVVLIIGILAAVALPQYQKAVVKSQYAKLKVLVASMVQAQELYYLEKGEYSTKFADLALDMPANQLASSDDRHARYGWGFCYLDTGVWTAMVACTNEKIKMEYQQRLVHVKGTAGQRYCAVFTQDLTDVTSQVCLAETKRSTNSGGDGSTYMTFRY